MSATYKCDFCNKKATHCVGKFGTNTYSHQTEVSKKLYGKGSCIFYATLQIEHKWNEYKQDEDIDLCEKCLNEIKIKAMKQICKE